MSNPVGIISMQFVRPFTGRDLHLFERIKRIGFDFVELLVPEPEDDLALSEVRRALADAGLAVVLAARVNLERSIASADAEARAGGGTYLQHCIHVAETLGAKILGGPLYGEPLVFAGRPPAPVAEDERQQRVTRCIDGLGPVAALAGQVAIKLALEPLNRFETDIVSTVQQGIAVVDAVADPALGLLLDTFHMNMEERDLAAAIRAAGSRIHHFQANENHRGFPGTGHIDWVRIAAALGDVDYTGPISLEPFRRDDDRVAVPIAQWRPPHEDESEKLQAGLNLIRSVLALRGVSR